MPILSDSGSIFSCLVVGFLVTGLGIEGWLPKHKLFHLIALLIGKFFFGIFQLCGILFGCISCPIDPKPFRPASSSPSTTMSSRFGSSACLQYAGVRMPTLVCEHWQVNNHEGRSSKLGSILGSCSKGCRTILGTERGTHI